MTFILIQNNWTRFVMVFASILLSACASTTKRLPAPEIPPPAYASYFDKLPCNTRIGRCFDARIGDQLVVVIADKQRHEELTRQARAANDGVRDIYWEVPSPVEGQQALDIAVSANALGRSVAGEPKAAPDSMIYPLDGQNLKSRAEFVSSETVKINGRAAVSQQNTLQQDHLPSGRYVISITYFGTLMWDRKFVYLRVK